MQLLKPLTQQVILSFLRSHQTEMCTLWFLLRIWSLLILNSLLLPIDCKVNLVQNLVSCTVNFCIYSALSDSSKIHRMTCSTKDFTQISQVLKPPPHGPTYPADCIHCLCSLWFISSHLVCWTSAEPQLHRHVLGKRNYKCRMKNWSWREVLKHFKESLIVTLSRKGSAELNSWFPQKLLLRFCFPVNYDVLVGIPNSR